MKVQKSLKYKTAKGKTVIINEAFAQKVLKIVDAGLSSGVGYPTPGKMCVEHAVAFAYGATYTDKPICVDPDLRNWKIGLNDADGWQSPADRAAGLRRLAVAQLGSRNHFSIDLFRASIKKALAEVLGNFIMERFAHGEVLPPADLRYIDYPYIAQGDSAVNLLKVLYPTRDRGEHLKALAEMGVQALIEQNVPGTKFLYLTEPKKPKAKAKAKAKKKL